MRFFLISACVIGWLSGFGFPIKDGISGVLISLNLFSKWFATVLRISFGFVVSLPSLYSTSGKNQDKKKTKERTTKQTNKQKKKQPKMYGYSVVFS